MSDFVQFERLLHRQVAEVARLTPLQIRALFDHYELMLRWNRRLNLTRIVDLEDAVQRHYAESVLLAARIPDWVQSVVDIGSGAGFPGIPVAVARPELRVVLVESDQRKASFLREAGDLASNVEVRAVRAEALQDQFDACISRAVRPEDVLDVALRAGKWVGLLLSAADAAKIGWSGAQTEPLPAGGVLWTAHVPRGT